jgi:hypothetical protein
MILLELFQETTTKYERVALHLFNDSDMEFEEACRMLGEWKTKSTKKVGSIVRISTWYLRLLHPVDILHQRIIYRRKIIFYGRKVFFYGRKKTL